MKNLLALSLVAMILGTFVVGCGSGTSTTKTSVSTTVEKDKK